jgi:hypothetical protein
MRERAVVAELGEFVRYLVTGKFRDVSTAESEQKKLPRRERSPSAALRARERESPHGGPRSITEHLTGQHSIMATTDQEAPVEEAPVEAREPAGNDRHAAA